MNKIESALAKLFEKFRIVFWYDEGEDLRPEFDELQLPGVEKIELKQNEFGVKYRVLRQEQQKKFLLYSAAAEPDPQDNWLLDVRLANTVFSADKASLWLAELGLGTAYKSLVTEHKIFFQSDNRRAAFKERLKNGDSDMQLRLKMMAVSLGSSVEPSVEKILMVLLEELAGDSHEKYDTLEKFGLLKYLWKKVEQTFAYQSSDPHIVDFAIKLFESGFHLCLQANAQMSPEALIFLNRWQDSVTGQRSYNVLANRYEKLLEIGSKLENYSIEDLARCDIFKGIDKQILESMMEKVLDQTLSAQACSEIINQRKATHWYKESIASMYQALEIATDLLGLIRNSNFEIADFLDGFTKYVNLWFRIDQLYRNYYFHVRQSRENTFFERLNRQVEAQYSNNFLWPVNNRWQLIVDGARNWTDLPVMKQNDFFQNHVLGLLQSGAKAAVVISDGLRFEVAEELERKVEEAGRFTATLSAMAGMLPSYTALGMAALLPNKTLGIQTDGNVMVDGNSSAGLDNRNKILAEANNSGARALTASDFKKMSNDDRRALFRENQVVYVYHNQIDLVGDKRESEEQTVEAAADTVNELVVLIKLLRSANFSKILITADHGFLYQYQKLDETDLAGSEISGKEIYLKKRRFAIGKELENTGHQLKVFNAEQLGLVGDCEVLLAKSVNRLKLSGAGMQYVHGGSSLQEIVIPVLAVNMVRGPEFEAQKVKVEKLSSSSNTITTGQITIKFIQLEPISSKKLPRTLRVGIYGDDGLLISDVKTLSFDFDSENQRDRELEVTLILSKDWQKYNRQYVKLRLEESLPNTDKYKTYLQWSYFLNRTHFADF